MPFCFAMRVFYTNFALRNQEEKKYYARDFGTRA